jgi:8-amino-7-oxononanoate synthase
MSGSAALSARLRAALDARRSQHLLRQLQTTQDDTAPMQIQQNGTRLTNFASNDYLGLRQCDEIKQAFAEAALRYGLGAGASHLLGGHHPEHAALEAQLAAWVNRPRALLFSSGFQAALAVLSACVSADDVVIADRLAHACMLDGLKLAGAKVRRFVHNDLAHAGTLLARPSPENTLRFLLSESIFSMDGDAAPVAALAALAQTHGASLMLDEAHAIGVYGPNGAGLAAAQKVTVEQCPILMLTFGKALGSAGAAICGDENLIDTLINFARPYIYTTAMPVAIAAATRKAVQVAQASADRRDQLSANIAYFRHLAGAAGIALGASISAIQPVLVASADVMAVAQKLWAAGFYVPAIRPPTVPPGGARLRISLSSLHSKPMIANLVNALERILERTLAPAPRA